MTDCPQCGRGALDTHWNRRDKCWDRWCLRCDYGDIRFDDELEETP